jgi:uncharacterized protein (DUF2235 family)
MKRLILCCDGTWNSADQASDGNPCPTNVLRIAYRIAKREGDTPQILFYDEGVGTGNAVDRVSGGAFGRGLDTNIFDGYRFLVANYEVGDRIFLFGFSRGAFTVRSLAGMIRNCGILKRESVDRYAEALELYRDPKHHPDSARSVDFRGDYSVTGETTVPIHFIGVWDTVGSLGIPLRGLRWVTRRKYQFHDTALSRSVRNAYHALAIDERRAPFAPTLWHSPAGPPGGSPPQPDARKMEQVWFCGVHSDIGGGYPEREVSDIALEWMIDRARDADLVFDDRVIAHLPSRPDPTAPLHESKKGLYRLTPGIDRPIGKPVPKQPGEPPPPGEDPTQSLHPTVLERWDNDPTYRPPGLLDFFRRRGDPRATG